MQFDKFDRKIQEAAERHRPLYDEQGWSKMEDLLNKHLPEKKDSGLKPILYPVLILLLIAIGSLTRQIIFRPEKVQSAVVRTVAEPSGKNKITTLQTNTATGRSNRKLQLSQNQLVEKELRSTLPGYNNSAQNMRTPAAIPLAANVPTSDQPGTSMNDKRIDSQRSASSPKMIDEASKAEANIQTTSNAAHAESTSLSTKDANTVGTGMTEIKDKKRTRSFTLDVSLGVQASGIDARHLGRLSPAYGVGFTYRANRWGIRAGVYRVAEVYKADREDYHPAAKFWNDYPFLDEVSANCNVLEVPLIIDYSFGHRAKHRYFGSVGISSYFMNKETYHYVSELPSQQYSADTATIWNENVHYLSSLRLSAGYRKQLNNRISLSAEPYINIPFNGIGFGRVKLNSAGVLLTISTKLGGR